MYVCVFVCVCLCVCVCVCVCVSAKVSMYTCGWEDNFFAPFKCLSKGGPNVSMCLILVMIHTIQLEKF